MAGTVFISIARNDRKMDEQLFMKLLLELPVVMKNEVLRYRRFQDAQACLLGKIMLKDGLARHFRHSNALGKMIRTKFNRLILADVNIDFSISHSGSLVICSMVENARIGIDVEEIRQVAIEDFTAVFTDEELLDLSISKNKLKLFYTFWTRKESIIKADGRGMSAPIKNICFVNEENRATLDGMEWFLSEVSVDEYYCCCLASSERINKSGIKLEQFQYE